MSSSAPTTTTSIRLLPRENDKVLIDGLRSATQHNGKTGILLDFHQEQERFRVLVAGETSKPLGLKWKNLTVVERVSVIEEGPLSPIGKPAPIHVLIPCHVSTRRRLVTFMRCAKSVVNQEHNDYSVLIGLSGPAQFRSLTFNFLTLLATKTDIRLYIQHDDCESKPQMEHLRHLVRDSLTLNRTALLMFVDNDDMFHPMRITYFYQAYQDNYLSEGTAPLSFPCKLLLDSNMTAEEGAYEKFVDMKNVDEFNHWKKHCATSKKVTFASNKTVADLDAQEYFDFIVPSLVMEKFFDLTPVKVSSHRFCDLRLFQILEHLCTLEPPDAPDVWLLAHYKVPLEENIKPLIITDSEVLTSGWRLAQLIKPLL